jgi:hypothetical protein
MTSTVQFEVWQAIRSPQSFEATTTHHGNTWELVAPAGEYVLAGKSPEGMFYLSREQLKCSAREAWGGLFVPQGSSTPSEIVFTWAPWSRFGDRPFNLYGAPIKSATTLAPAKSLLEPINADFVATLSYAGVSGGQIKFVYKEFNVESSGPVERMLARPAYTQEVSLDYKQGETYGYKNARFIVHEAGPTHTVYTLLSHL